LDARQQEVVVTGLGAVSALGYGCSALWQAVQSGHDGIRPISRFSTSDFTVDLGAMVPGHDDAMALDDQVASSRLCLRYAMEAVREAWEHAQVARRRVRPERIALVLGTSLGARDSLLHRLAEKVAETFQIRGPVITVSTACSSSTGAIGVALELLNGSADLVVAGGMDVLTPEVFAGFHALGVLSTGKCAPFSHPVGTTLGEGAGFVVLEPIEQARSGGVNPIVTLMGYGLSGDAYHETSPEPSGAGVERAISNAVLDAAVDKGNIDYINAHGSGTQANDPAEWRAVQKVFGDRSNEIAISSVKSYLGHAQGAAGVLEVIVTILSMQHGVVPPTLHFKAPRPLCPRDPIGDTHPRKHANRHSLSISSAFGGSNAAVILGKPGSGGRPLSWKPVWILGAGVVGPQGLDLQSFSKSLEAEKPIRSRVSPFSIDCVIPTADPRGLDPASTFLTAAAANSLKDAGIKLHGRLRERTGLVVGTTHLSPKCGEAFRRSIDERGLSRLSAKAFARIVLNASAGSCSKILSLKGPNTTLTTGIGCGLAAIVLATKMLSSRDDADMIVAGGVDELAEQTEEAGVMSQEDLTQTWQAEGAGCVLLGVEPRQLKDGQVGSVCIAGWGLAGSGDLNTAIDHALSLAGLETRDIQVVCAAENGDQLADLVGEWIRDVPQINPVRVLGLAEAASSAWSCIAGVLALRNGNADVALVLSTAGGSVGCALVLTRK
jgi:3-oxoacyl-[acyl-carrier-protein] synthase II